MNFVFLCGLNRAKQTEILAELTRFYVSPGVLWHTLQSSDVPGDFVAVNELLAQVSPLAMPLIITDNDRGRH